MRRSVLLVLIAAVAVWPHEPARAVDVPAVDFTTSTFTYHVWRADTLGYEFKVRDSVEVTMLGLYYPEKMTGQTEVGLWTSSGVELARTLVGPADPEGLWVWTAITPVTLEAGHNYIVGGFVYNSWPAYGQPAPENWTVDPRIEFVHPRSSSSYSFAVPDIVSGGTYYGNFGGNLKLKGPDLVPEPGLIQLPFLLAMGAAGAWRRRAR